MLRWLLGTTREAMHPKQWVIFGVQWLVVSIVGPLLLARWRAGLSWPVTLLLIVVLAIIAPPLIFGAWSRLGHPLPASPPPDPASAAAPVSPAAGPVFARRPTSGLREELSEYLRELIVIRDSTPQNRGSAEGDHDFAATQADFVRRLRQHVIEHCPEKLDSLYQRTGPFFQFKYDYANLRETADGYIRGLSSVIQDLPKEAATPRAASPESDRPTTQLPRPTGAEARRMSSAKVPDFARAFSGLTHIQAEQMATPYLGAWLQVEGQLQGIQDVGEGALLGSFPQTAVDGTIYVMLLWFGAEWRDRVSLLHKGQRIRAEGRIDKVLPDQIHLKECALLDGPADL